MDGEHHVLVVAVNLLLYFVDHLPQLVQGLVVALDILASRVCGYVAHITWRQIYNAVLGTSAVFGLLDHFLVFHMEKDLAGTHHVVVTIKLFCQLDSSLLYLDVAHSLP